MSEEQPTTLEHVKDYRFVIMVIGSIMIALVLVAVALGLYGSSGAYQLDLSRPSDVSLRSQVQEDSSFKGFSSEGELNFQTMSEFQNMYDNKLGDVMSAPLFNGEILSPKTLGIDQRSATKYLNK